MSAARGRGSTHPGRPAPHPSAAYAAPALVTPGVHGPVVPFLGEDGRAQIFDAAGWPLPGWHEALTAAFAVRVGPGGGLRTLKSAKGCWVKTRRLISFLSALPDAPPGPGSLRVEHLMAFRAHRATTNALTAWAEVKNFGHLAQLKPLRDMVSPDVLRYLTQRVERQVPHRSRPGYSDGELRRVLRAARQDVAALSDRIGAGEFLLHRWRTAAEDLSSEEGVLGESLALMADGGDVVPMSFPGLGTPRSLGERSALARNLFLGHGGPDAVHGAAGRDVWPQHRDDQGVASAAHRAGGQSRSAAAGQTTPRSPALEGVGHLGDRTTRGGAHHRGRPVSAAASPDGPQSRAVGVDRPGGLLAAKLHLKHIATATTEGYASRPGGAQAELLAEVNKQKPSATWIWSGPSSATTSKGSCPPVQEPAS